MVYLLNCAAASIMLFETYVLRSINMGKQQETYHNTQESAPLFLDKSLSKRVSLF